MRTPSALLLFTLWFSVSCSSAFDPRALSATTFGHLLPTGTALVEETYYPRREYSEGFVSYRDCGILRRVFATNDPDAFLTAVLGAARSAGWEVATLPTKAQIGIRGAVRLRGERTVTSLVFYDYDDPQNHPLAYDKRADGHLSGPIIDVRAWRYMARLWVRDASDRGWSDCVDETRVNP